jgi:hypothetical protein
MVSWVHNLGHSNAKSLVIELEQAFPFDTTLYMARFVIIYTKAIKGGGGREKVEKNNAEIAGMPLLGAACWMVSQFNLSYQA